MSSKPTVFIHGKKDQWIGMRVAEYSLKRNSRHPDLFDVKMIFVEDNPFLMACERRVFKKDRQAARWRRKDPQSFTLLRFLPPKLMNYQGRAVVIDPDIFAVGDVYELLTRDMQGKAVFCHDAGSAVTEKGVRHNYLTSVMLMDCAKLKHWQWEKQVEEMFSGKRYYTKWVMLGYEPPETIGLLEKEWNHLDFLNENTKLLHNTRRATQPWLTGLPYFRIPFYSNVKKIGGIFPEHWWHGLKSLLQGRGYLPFGKHLKHPDPNQEKFFFTLMKECLNTGFISPKELEREIRAKTIRPDAFALADAA